MLKSPSQKKAHDEQLHLNVKSETSYTPLHQAAIAGDDAAVEVLLISGASRFATDNKVRPFNSFIFIIFVEKNSSNLKNLHFVLIFFSNVCSMEIHHCMRLHGVDTVDV